ncbi:cell envelope-related transcriptional attenuator [Pseudanabaena biceps PCC 7429]|uniref:Cell envelope-related transcriptional attenuator n=1 Tax=Pseudanabaena biceps PCC 7429 TaxID=927668 RepID=L8MX39_9CYAN|nr:cell envelope-related transcriptional attenuator [Pseudanabaena biceps PCC 7429]
MLFVEHYRSTEWCVSNRPITASKIRSADPTNRADLPVNSSESKQISKPAVPKNKQKRIPFAKIGFSLSLLLSIGAGTLLGRVIPINAIDWGGLLSGRKPEEVLMESLGRKLERPYQILVLGVDRVLEAPLGSPESFNGRSDSMLLIRFDPDTRSVDILSIPRDTQVPIPGYGVTKINAANVYGGAALAQEIVSEKLNDVEIDRYVRLDTSGLSALVDALGGIEVNVPKRMKYVDKTQKLNINLYPGLQTLNGEQAEGYARFRHDEDGDLGRIQRQQIVLKALKAKIAHPSIVMHLPDLINIMKKHVDSNLSFDEMMAISTFSLTVKPDRIKANSLKGRPSEPNEFRYSYWIVNSDDVEMAIAGKFKTK